MTTNTPRARLHQLPAPKASPTIFTAKTSALSVSSYKSPEPSRSPSRSRQGVKLNATTPVSQQDAISNKATASLIRRVLCPQASNHGPEQRERGSPRPLDELLPPLTSSNEVDLQLYALIAIIIKEFVHTWYTKITPDHAFTEEVIQVIAHCTRALEQRLRTVDIDALVLDEIPSLIEAHILAYRTAQKCPQLDRSNSHLRVVYHTLNPHPALSPVPDKADPSTITDQEEREAVYRQLLVQGVLAVLLPTEDLENICLRTLVGDILADLIIGEVVCEKVCEGWFLWEIITKVISLVRQNEQSDKAVQHGKEGRLEKFGLLSTLEERHTRDSSNRNQSKLSDVLWRLLQYGYLIYIALRFVVVGLFRVASSPSPLSSRHWPSESAPSTPINPASKKLSRSNSNISRTPVLRYRLFGMVSQLVDVSNRMPWLGGILALGQHSLLEGPGRVGEADGVLDRFLHQTIQNHLLTPTFLPILLRAARTTLFPFNARPAPNSNLMPNLAIDSTPTSIATKAYGQAAGIGASTASPNFNTSNVKHDLTSSLTPPPPAPTPLTVAPNHPPKSQPPSDPQIKAIRRACAASIISLIPTRVALVIFGIPTDGPQLSYATSTSSPAHGAKTGEYFVEQQSSAAPSSHSSPMPGAGPEHAPDYATASTNLGNSNSDLTGPQRDANNDDDGGRHTATNAFNDVDEQLLAAVETEILDLFSDTYCNKHLVYSIIEIVLVKLLPELAERGITELMTERGL
ncbi:hypothetical protein AJ80_07775 [Polytolypa hystricis UAMH7299]|uniref:PXA domain-containing protein n=1 Tax=Polytolypa hystricis (strain UAMH7299) TaxID=1447883 RepID=A0A2B7XI55_POLH7|nr:hypothetical protein AJ80_07775 [Polytolypa hystricis UAMH7299]